MASSIPSGDGPPWFDGFARASKVREMQNRLREVIDPNETLASAAQRFTDMLFEELFKSVVLARLYATIPFSVLPQPISDYVSSLTKTRGVDAQLKPTTPVWTLLGSRGMSAAWNDRAQSKNHVGLPLLSAEFVDQFPMVSRLFAQLAIDVSWQPSSTNDIVLGRLVGTDSTGFFYVEDARAAVDRLGRPIIPSQDFVKAYDVRTVFGMGGQYANGTLAATIVFAREPIAEPLARKLAPLFGSFHAITTPTVFADRLI